VFLRRDPAPAAVLERVRRAVAALEDPEIHRPLGELKMVRGVTAERGAVRVEVALTTARSPTADRLRDDVVAAAVAAGAPGVEVHFSVMTERDRMEVAQHLRAISRPADAVTGRRSPASRVYAVASGKGGVGKSSVTANLAVGLALAGQRVGVLDADVWGYSMPQLFGVRRSPVALKGLMLPVEAHGVRLMSTGFFVDDEEPVIWRGPMLHKALQQFVEDVHWGELDVLLLDLPPGTGDVALSLLELLPEAALLAVTTPQVAAQTVAARVGRMALDMRMPVAGVIENMSAMVCQRCHHQSQLFGSGGGQRLATALSAPLLGQIPLDTAMREAGDCGTPVVLRTPSAASSTELLRVAGALPTARRSLVGRPLSLTVVRGA